MKKIFLSILSGAVLVVLNWFFINSYFTTKPEEVFYEKITLLRNNILHDSVNVSGLAFINTANDITVIRSGRTRVAAVNRQDLVKFFQVLISQKAKPKAIALDQDFYDAYSPDPKVDDTLNAIIKKVSNVLIPVKINSGKIDTPVIHARYGTAGYDTYGLDVDKVKVFETSPLLPSLPALLHSVANGVNYQFRHGLLTANGKLCLNYIWPEYYLKSDEPGRVPPVATNQLETMLLDFRDMPRNIHADIDGKVVFMGAFDQKVPTQAEQVEGVKVAANIYLTLRSGQHYITLWWVLFIFTAYSVLSFYTWFEQLPQLKKFFHGFFSDVLADYAKKWFSYTVSVLALSFFSIFIFHMSANVIVTGFILSAISFVRFDEHVSNFLIWLRKKIKTHA
jgi:hypothetical protein